MSGIEVVFGAATVNKGYPFGSTKTLQTVLDALEKSSIRIIDTAALYGESERLLGELEAGKTFTIDTKTRGGWREAGGSREVILEESKNSREKLGGNVDVYYSHARDYNTDLEVTLAAINEVYESGFFKRFGLSNYKAEDVEKIYKIANEKGYVLPTVYQGNYNPIARLPETELLPTLRKLGIAFYAYSPLAGGFLTKDKNEIAQGTGRFNNSDEPLSTIYSEMYSKPSFIDALAEWESIAQDEGITRADLAYRWVRYNSTLKPEHGDAIIIGARTLHQLGETLSSINSGPLSEKAVKRIDGVWRSLEKDAALDNFHRK